MERVWGGRRLADRFGKPLPDGAVIGESWELVDRPEAQSVVSGGTLDGTSLHDLWRSRRAELFGARGAASTAERFPLLVKLLDCAQTLSVQVHPPAEVAGELGGQPKTEMWVIVDAEPGSHLLAGLREGVDRAAFEHALVAGRDVSALLHRIDVVAGDVMFLPSGRVHAIGAGNVICEIQQNSDTTYRVYDFGRPGLDGRPRELHVEQSLRSIDWDDAAPGLVRPEGERLVHHQLFEVDRLSPVAPRAAATPGECAVLFVLAGRLRCGGATLEPGDLALAPACAALELGPVGDDPPQILRIAFGRDAR